MSRFLQISCIIIVIFSLLFICHRITYRRAFTEGQNRAFETLEARIDTIYHRDTITIVKPKENAVFVRDTIWLSVTDTVRVRDTLFTVMPKEVKIYQDSSYYAEVSGIQPNLDMIKVYPLTTVVNSTQIRYKPCRWSIGIQAGAGIGYNDGFRAFPYVGIGLQYSLINFQK